MPVQDPQTDKQAFIKYLTTSKFVWDDKILNMIGDTLNKDKTRFGIGWSASWAEFILLMNEVVRE